jgi:hypothetical protein
MHSIGSRRRCAVRSVGIAAAVAALAFSGAALAFKLGDRPEPADAPAPQEGMSFDIHFGDPVHEDMAKASLALAKREAGRMACSTSADAVDAYMKNPAPAMLSHRMCCHLGASSKVCDSLEAAGQDRPFADISRPLISGVRWNDDICHMTHAGRSGFGWAAGWMTGLGVMRFNNANYASHYHELQFLHAMAPVARGDDPNPNALQDADTTYRRILMWTEFAFRVAEGTIPAHSTLGQAKRQLEPAARKGFDLAFGGYSTRKVSLLFTGIDDASEAQVRQMALGALLHTVQDSFSSSHTEREADPMYRMTPLVGGKGRIVRFHNYRIQSPSRHGTADHRPLDLEDAAVGDLHPVALGAELIACAASAQPAGPSAWRTARGIAARSFELARPGPNLRANAGRLYQDRIADGTEAP